MNHKDTLPEKKIQKKLWHLINDLRGSLENTDLQNCVLGLIFLRYLSENIEIHAKFLLQESNFTFEEAWANKNLRDKLNIQLIQKVGYAIEPENMFSKLIEAIEDRLFEIEILHKSIISIIESTKDSNNQNIFRSIFEYLDLTSSKLGRDLQSRSRIISKIMIYINEIPFLQDDEGLNSLGSAFEYLLSQFALISGKTAGGFHTPDPVSQLIAKIVTFRKKQIDSVYDPTCGSGSLLIHIGKEARVKKYFGQEKMPSNYNLALMNLILHGVPIQAIDIHNDDTLEHPHHMHMKFETIVANPPFSANWSANLSFLEDERFSEYQRLAPKSKADFAFVQHMIYHLKDNGTMAVILPLGVLFRGAAEGAIRNILVIEKNYLDAVIGLPANIFFGTSIPTCILVFKKGRQLDDNIIFIDASNEYGKGKSYNYLRDEDIQKIINTYTERKSIAHYSAVVDIQTIVKNEINLNIPRYIDTFIEIESVDLNAIQKRISVVKEEILLIDAEINDSLKKLR